MNIRKVVLSGYFTPYTKSYGLTIIYPQSYVVGFDCYGNQVRELREKSQTFYGITKTQCRERATQFLKDCKHEEIHHYHIVDRRRFNGLVRDVV